MNKTTWEWIASTIKGYAVYRKPSGYGYVYMSDEIGDGLLVCDMSRLDPSTLEAIVAIERSSLND